MSNQEINKNHDEFDNANPSLSATNNDSPSTGSSPSTCASASTGSSASASTSASQEGSQEPCQDQADSLDAPQFHESHEPGQELCQESGQDSTLEPSSNNPGDTKDEPKLEATAQAEATAVACANGSQESNARDTAEDTVAGAAKVAVGPDKDGAKSDVAKAKPMVSDEASQIKIEGQDQSGDDSNSQMDNGASFKIGDDVSKFTGRPHISAEENQALAKGNRFFHKALESSARARGDHYEPYSLPAHMRAALAQIDMESAQERMEERKKALEEQGLDSSNVTLETNILSKLHNLSAEEQEELARNKDMQEHINAGGARFYGKYQNLLNKQAQAKEESRIKILRNIKLMGIVMLGLVGYIAYNHFMVDRNADSIETLKASLPLVIDEHTTMVRIDDRNNNNFKIYFEKDPAIFADYDEHQKEAALDQFVKNAPGLCKNQLLRSIIVSGKKVTVLLEASDRSFFREFSVDKCPSKDDAS